MALPKINPTQTKAWKKLHDHFLNIKDVHMTHWFNLDEDRAANMTIKWQDFYVDYSKNRMDAITMDLLLELAEETHLKSAIDKQFQGEVINETEGREVLHTALRSPETGKLVVDGSDIIPEIHAVRKKIKAFTTDILEGKRKGYTNKAFTDVVNIGIGGSDLGPAMVVDALQYYKNGLTTHFVSNVDGDHINEVLKSLNPETTLFIVVSKTFTTQETLCNANTMKDWFLKSASEFDVAKHFVAVSTNIESVKNFGISEHNIFPMWDWVGGRFSLWSAVGLSISLAVGYDNFDRLLSGAYSMDEHFRSENLKTNIPVVLALIGIWYTNFYESESEVVISYSHYLDQFATYLQQANMESNGKSIDRNGKKVTYHTGNVVWGGPGSNSQHAFFQLIHQGTKLVPADFIGFTKSLHGNKKHQDKLMSNFIAQTEALLNGKPEEVVVNELTIDQASAETIKKLAPFKVFEGNKPTNTLLINQLTPESLGKLIALYEHKIFVQGVIWNVYSYDQFGVELGKQLASNILKEFDTNDQITDHDSSTVNLLTYYKNLR